MRKNELSLLVLCRLYVNLNLVANLELRVVAELRYRDDTLALTSDGYNNLTLVD